MSGIRTTSERFPMNRGAVVIVLVLIIGSLFGQRSILAYDDPAKPKKPRFELTDRTIKDNRSGLMWSLNGSLTDLTYSQRDAFEYIEELNLDRYAGYRDWRLPSREELLSLVRHAHELGFRGQSADRTVAAGLQSIGMQNVQPGEYWSSTGNLYNASEAWFVNFRDGSPGTGDRTLYLSVWPVRYADE